MIGFNHALVGGLIGKLVPLPVALPLAVASHFALDTLPHYGIPHGHRDNSNFWKYFFTIDFFATFGLAVWAIYFQHYAMFFCGLLAVLPDFVWVAKVVKNRSFNLLSDNSHYEKWHIAIQKHEYHWGIWPELVITLALFWVVIIGTK
jgi:hypothetical protein